MSDILRHVEVIHREKDIDKELIFQALESAYSAAIKKHLGKPKEAEVTVVIDRETGAFAATDEGGPVEVDMAALGRIAAQTAKQVMAQKIREAEREVILKEYETKVGAMVNGTVQRQEGSVVVVNLGKAEGILPRSEQIYGELYRPGERVRCVILRVEAVGPSVKIILSRTSPDLVRRLFEVEVPEISEHVIEMKALVREPGFRTKVAVSSVDSRVDPVGACVGVRGSRIKNVVDELSGEKVDIIPWSDDPQTFIGNSLKPAPVLDVRLFPKCRRAEVIVADDKLSLAIGRRGQNVRLAAKISGWDVDVFAPRQFEERWSRGKAEIAELPGVGEDGVRAFVEMGLAGHADIVDSGLDKLMQVEGMDEARAQAIYTLSLEKERERIEREKKEAEAKAAELAAEAVAQAAGAQAAAASPEAAVPPPAVTGEGA